MKDFFKTDEAMIDLLIILGVFLLIYISKNITPLTIATVASGEAEGNLLSFLGMKFNFGSLGNMFFSMENALGVLGIILLGGVVLLSKRISDINKKDREKYEPVAAKEVEAKAALVQWQVVLNHVNSESPSEWKLAILEADNMLDEILEAEGYQGETLADKLKAMPPGAIHSYQDLWDAHKVRNDVAHRTESMDLTKKMARDTINKFEMAFRELGHI